MRIKPFYGQNYEHDAIKVRNIPSCVLILDKPQVRTRETLSTGEWVSLLYAWFRLVIDKKVLKSLLTVVPNGLVRHPDPNPLQATKRVRFE